ncbi:MAG: histidine kinase [Prosthecobacter sp.]
MADSTSDMHPSRIIVILLSVILISAVQADVITIAEARAKLASGDDSSMSVRGKVTFCSQKLGLAFVQDVTGGIGFDPRSALHPAPKPGDWVEVTGAVKKRHGVTMVLGEKKSEGTKVNPCQPLLMDIKTLPFELDDASQLRIDSVLTQVVGVIREVNVPADVNMPMRVEISSPSGYAVAHLPWREPKEVLDGWRDAVVTMTAVLVCRVGLPLIPSDADALLLVPGKTAWTVRKDALDEVFARPPVTSIHGIGVAPRNGTASRLHVQGVVTADRRRQWFTMRVGDASVQVFTRQENRPAPGERVSVACWPQTLANRLVCLDGVCRSLGWEAEPEPVVIGKQITSGAQSLAELIQVTGVLNSHHLTGDVPRLTVTLPSGQNCVIQWNTFLDAETASRLSDGSLIRVTGVLNALHKYIKTETWAGFSILPRTAGDLEELSPPQWWTRDRLVFATWSLLGILGIVVPAVMISRWQVRRQQEHIRAIEGQAIAEEERRRIAREFHDSLQQQLTGAALHLEALRGAIDVAPSMLPRMIDDTSAMIRHCQIEARHCIWDLRSDAPTRESLAQSLDEWLQMRAAQSAVAVIHFDMQGDMPPMGDEVPFQIMRITQEAVSNALAHAGATDIHVCLIGSPDGLTLVVADDGRGFDPDKPGPGHFGLRSQRERAQKIGAQLSFSRAAGRGTIVTLQVRALTHEPFHLYA